MLNELGVENALFEKKTELLKLKKKVRKPKMKIFKVGFSSRQILENLEPIFVIRI